MAENRAIRGKGEGGLFRVPADPSKPLKYWQGVVELPNPTGRAQDRRRKVVRSKDKREAIRKLGEAQDELRKKGDLKTSSIAVEDWFAYWMEHHVVPELRPKAVESYRSAIRRQIIPSLGSRTRIDKITPSMVKRVRADMIAKGRSSSYARNAHHILARSLHDAAGEGRIPSNPAEYVRPPRRALVKLDVLDLPDSIRLLQEVQERPDAARWATSLLTAARRGEVIGIERDRIDGDVLDLSWQLQRLKKTPDGVPEVPADHEYRHIRGGLYFTRPKTSAGWRIIPLVDPLRSILLRHIDNTPENPWGLVFTDPRGNPRDPDADSKAWGVLMRATFGEDRSVRLHDLRHTAVDLLYAAGVPEDIIQEIVGHSTRAQSRSYKSRSDIRRLRDAMEQFSGQFMLPPGTREAISG